MKGFKVEIAQTLAEEVQPEGDYTNWSKAFNNEFVDVSLVEKYPDVVTEKNIKKGDVVFVVWTERSVGDSFGWASKNDAEAQGVFLDEAAADNFANFLEATSDVDLLKSSPENVQKFISTKKEFKPFLSQIEIIADEDMTSPSSIMKFKSIDDQVFTFRYFTWVGHFDSLEDVRVDRAIIK